MCSSFALHYNIHIISFIDHIYTFAIRSAPPNARPAVATCSPLRAASISRPCWRTWAPSGSQPMRPSTICTMACCAGASSAPTSWRTPFGSRRPPAVRRPIRRRSAAGPSARCWRVCASSSYDTARLQLGTDVSKSMPFEAYWPQIFGGQTMMGFQPLECFFQLLLLD